MSNLITKSSCIILSLIYLWLGINHLTNIDYFSYLIRNYSLGFINQSADVVAYLLSFLLLVLSSGILFISIKNYLRIAFYYYAILSVIILIQIIRNEFFDCACGLFYKSMSPAQTLAIYITTLIVIELCITKYKSNVDITFNLKKTSP
jgi:hypothetical protein